MLPRPSCTSRTIGNLATNYRPRNHRADQSKPCADEHHRAEPGDVGLIDGLLDGRMDRCAHAWRDLDAGQLDRLPGNGLLHPGWQIQGRQTMLKAGAEDVHEDDAQDGDSQQAARTRDGIVDFRGCTRFILTNRVHHRCGQWRNGNGHAQAHHQDGGEVGRPVGASDARHGEEQEAKRSDGWPNDQRQLRAEAFHHSPCPTREQEHDQGKWREGRAGSRRGVSLHLNQVEGQEVGRPAQSSVQ